MSDQAQQLRDIVSREKDRKVIVYTITSGKGGVGKSNTAVNLAYALKDTGKKVLIIDTDQGFANVNVLLGITPRHTLQDVIKGDVNLEDAIIEFDGIKIIPGGNDVLDFSKINDGAEKKFQEQFLTLEGIDSIVVDTGAGISTTILSYIIFGHETILITTPEITSMTDVYSMLKNIDALKLKGSAKIIVNRARDEEEALDTFERLKLVTNRYLTIDIEYLGFIYEDSSVSASVMEQVPFIKLYPKSRASLSLKRVTKVLLGEREYSKGSTIGEIYSRIVNIFNGG